MWQIFGSSSAQDCDFRYQVAAYGTLLNLFRVRIGNYVYFCRLLNTDRNEANLLVSISLTLCIICWFIKLHYHDLLLFRSNDMLRSSFSTIF